MSHFTCLVIVEDAGTRLEAEGAAEYMLEFYNENREVAAYREDLDAMDTAEAVRSAGLDGSASLQDVAAAVSGYLFGDSIEVHADEQTGDLYYFSTSNPDGKWDWYDLGGRWSGSLLNRVTGEHCDVLQVRDLDLDTMRSNAAKAAHSEYDKVEAATSGLPLPRAYMDIHREVTAAGGTRDDAHAAYTAQPWVAAIKKIAPMFLANAVTEFKVHDGGRDAFVKEAVEGCLPVYAVLDDDGWHAQGEMGWFGMTRGEEQDSGSWSQQVTEAITQASDDAWLLMFDLHT